MNPDEQEAKSKRYSNSGVILLKLSSGNWACFNRGWDYCGTAPTLEGALSLWFPPTGVKILEKHDDLLNAAGL